MRTRSAFAKHRRRQARTTGLCLALLVALAATACSRGVFVAKTCDAALEARYFPVGSFSDIMRDLPWDFPWDDSDSDGTYRYWFSNHLSTMQEPSLFCGALPDIETYRFLWYRTFQNPVAVRIFRRADRYGLEAVILDGRSGYDLGKISRRVTKELSQTQWRRVVAALDEAGFWRMITGTGDIIGIDGAIWVIEARREGKYHVAARYAGVDGMDALGDVFLDLAGLHDI